MERRTLSLELEEARVKMAVMEEEAQLQTKQLEAILDVKQALTAQASADTESERAFHLCTLLVCFRA